LENTLKKLPQHFTLTAGALTVALLLSACGGGSSTPPASTTPADTTPPTVAITDNFAGATATGDVTFTFTTSEAATVTNSSIVVTGGTKGAFTQVDSTHATLVVTPTALTQGTITVNAPAGSVTDTAGNASTVAATPATQAYNTGVTNLTGGVFANNYTGATEAAWASAQGGAAGRYKDDGVGAQDWWSGVAATTDTVRSFYFGYGFSSAAKPWGLGGFVKAPANGTATVSAFSNVTVSVWGNSELFNTNPQLTVVLVGAPVGACEQKLKGTINATSINATTYTLAKASLTPIQPASPCAAITTNTVWSAGVKEVHVQVLGNQVQYVTGTAPWYANGLNIGPIIFN
jgi:hypothetical protein